MSEHDADMYAKTLNKVRNQVQALRTMLSSIEVHNYRHRIILVRKTSDSVIFFSLKTRKDNGFDIKPLEIWMKERYSIIMYSPICFIVVVF